jgi:hypothetical protein
MIGHVRLRNLRDLAEQVLVEGVPGDFIETGVWRGGACILLREVLKGYGVTNRRVFAADSFEGLPKTNVEHYPTDAGDGSGGAEVDGYRIGDDAAEELRQNFSITALFTDISRKIIRLEQQCSFPPRAGDLKKSFSLFFGFGASGPTDTFFRVLMTLGGCFHHTLPSPAGGSMIRLSATDAWPRNRCR